MKLDLSSYSYATNIAKSVSGELGQYAGGGKEDGTSNSYTIARKITSDTLELGRTPKDYDYSKEDAIQSAYNVHMGRTSLFSEWKAGPMFAPEGFENEITSIPTEINWSALESSMKNIKTSDIDQSIDYLSSIYVATKDHINTNFTGEVKENELAKLNELIGTYKDKTTNEFSEYVGGFLNENGSTGEVDKIKESLNNIFDEKVTAFTDTLTQNKDYANILGTKDEWLKNDVNYMASELEKATNSTKTSSVYSLNDLSVTYDAITEMQSYGFDVTGSKNSFDTYDSEEYVGIKLSELSLKTTLLTENADISQHIKDLISKTTDNFIQNTINEMNEVLEDSRKKPKMSGDIKGFASLDESAIKSVINQVMNTYEKTGSTSQALKSGISTAITNFNSKLGTLDGVYRYSGNSFADFFETTYATKLTNLTGTDYVKGVSEFDNILNSFNGFVDKLGMGKSYYINFNDFYTFA